MKKTITFLLYKAKSNSKGHCPIRCRITFLKKRKEFSTGLFINPNNWNSKQQLVEPPGPDIEYINTQLSLIRQNLNQAFLFLQVKGTPFTVLDQYLRDLGRGQSEIIVGRPKYSRFHNLGILSLIVN
jgi:hypothetical protein